MPQITNTPESLLPRTDSRNPATTCRGITANGRPCRRGLAATPRKGPCYGTDLASLYCWQHKDQAMSSIACSTSNAQVEPRTSIDTLMDRLGVLEIKDEQPVSHKTHRRGSKITSSANCGEKKKRRPAPKRTFCCFEVVDEDDEDFQPPSKPVHTTLPTRPVPGLSLSPQSPYQRAPRPSNAGPPHYVRVPSSPRPRVSSAPTSSRDGRRHHKNSSSCSSHTQSLLSWIPSTLSPQTTSLLLTEMAKPISSADEEGYIYMFWVTPPTTASPRGSSAARPSREIASSLLPADPGPSSTLRPPAQPRSVSEAIRAAQDLNALISSPTSTSPGTLRLKIGRTGNVHRRLTEWTRQCSHDLTLIRYYPYMPSSIGQHASASASTSSSPARRPPYRPRPDQQKHNSAEAGMPGCKVPHVHRVERLIHLELADLRVRDLGRCGECGKEHREWFEVAAAKEALRGVDECVRRWVAWGESV
ncbi:hypothetical protein NUU61_002202 [Penicillium alfredii]|uniref:Bacteriophage T5 Orf172 DNA-binding domain-containing protein n=1 Tax=Penicillium alfredii TaxID=1506179 RepID=A0A9W9FRW4_9EURO|nr:uncharacterized protein NUU61_002202 [Penicillium alfredii]KAJ5104855.1 hypothetical protein NUU61_002202 [Penicillium alfredii]